MLYALRGDFVLLFYYDKWPDLFGIIKHMLQRDIVYRPTHPFSRYLKIFFFVLQLPFCTYFSNKIHIQTSLPPPPGGKKETGRKNPSTSTSMFSQDLSKIEILDKQLA